jgi:DNA-binding transcriptional LysR family regulator
MARRDELSLQDLAGEDFVLFSEGATIRRLVTRTSERLGFRPRVSFEAGETSRIRSIVAEGLAVSVLPRSDALAPGPPVAVAALSDPDMVHRVFVAHRAGRRHGPAVRAFLELVGAGE